MSNSEIFVKNPHSILPVLEKRPKDVLEIVLPRDKADGTWAKIESLAMKNKVPLRATVSGRPARNDQKKEFKNETKKEVKKEIIGRESSHGALIRPKPPLSVEELFKNVDANTRGVWLALDSLQDPQNLGAIFRSAGFFGVRGIILTSERSAPMSSTVYDISSGGVEAVPYVPIINLQRAFEVAKKSNLWILGTSEHAKSSIQKLKNDRPWLIVFGNEENGMRRLTEESCDMMCVIPSKGEVDSLNVSVAAGIVLSHLA